MKEIFEQIPTYEEVQTKNIEQNKSKIMEITKKLIDLIMKKNSPEFESHIDFKKEEINFIKSKI
jgi:hypothetical protein